MSCTRKTLITGGDSGYALSYMESTKVGLLQARASGETKPKCPNPICAKTISLLIHAHFLNPFLQLDLSDILFKQLVR